MLHQQQKSSRLQRWGACAWGSRCTRRRWCWAAEQVRWGQHSVAEAERRLFIAALHDRANVRMVLLSESCMFLYPPAVVFLETLWERRSRINACAWPVVGDSNRRNVQRCRCPPAAFPAASRRSRGRAGVPCAQHICCSGTWPGVRPPACRERVSGLPRRVHGTGGRRLHRDMHTDKLTPGTWRKSSQWKVLTRCGAHCRPLQLCDLPPDAGLDRASSADCRTATT